MKEENDLPLHKLQQWMHYMLLNPVQNTDDGNNPYSPDAVINHSKRLSAQQHLAIYQRSYIARLRSCMAQQFSALEYALGEDIFRAFADDYLVLHPSHHYSLSLLGAHFADHLEASRPDAARDTKEDWIDFIIELAKFEYDVNVLFEQTAEEDYQVAEVTDPEERFQLLPLCALFKFRFPVRAFYTAFKAGENPALPFELESYSIVLRHNFKLYIYDLHAEQHQFLTFLKNGMDIPSAKEAFKLQNKADAETFEKIWPTWKQRWTEAKFFRVKG